MAGTRHQDSPITLHTCAPSGSWQSLCRSAQLNKPQDPRLLPRGSELWFEGRGAGGLRPAVFKSPVHPHGSHKGIWLSVYFSIYASAIFSPFGEGRKSYFKDTQPCRSTLPSTIKAGAGVGVGARKTWKAPRGEAWHPQGPLRLPGRRRCGPKSR